MILLRLLELLDADDTHGSPAEIPSLSKFCYRSFYQLFAASNSVTAVFPSRISAVSRAFKRATMAETTTPALATDETSTKVRHHRPHPLSEATASSPSQCGAVMLSGHATRCTAVIVLCHLRPPTPFVAARLSVGCMGMAAAVLDYLIALLSGMMATLHPCTASALVITTSLPCPMPQAFPTTAFRAIQYFPRQRSAPQRCTAAAQSLCPSALCTLL